MIWDIGPHIFNNSYVNKASESNALLLCFDGGRTLIGPARAGFSHALRSWRGDCPRLGGQCVYPFETDGVVFLAQGLTSPESGQYRWTDIETFRTLQPE